MIIAILSGVLVASMLASLWLGAFTLLRCESKKKTSFVMLQATVFMFLLGYMLEINSNLVGEGMIAMRVRYLGAAFAPAAYLMFTADYCEIKLSKLVYTLLLLLPSIVVVLMWTTPNFHNLVFTSIDYDTSMPVHKLAFAPAPLYYLNHAVSLACCAGIVGLTWYRLTNWDAKYRSTLILVMVCAVVPIAVNVTYMFGFAPYGIYLTPITCVIQNILFYISIVRHDSLGVVSIASEMALQSVQEAYILFDANDAYISSNTTAKKLFPTLETMEKGGLISQIHGWPPELAIHENKEIAGSVKFELPGNRYYTATVSSILSDEDNLLGHVILIQDITSHVTMTKKIQAAFDEVTTLKVQQDGDYFLTSLLINPLLTREVRSDALTVDFHVQQKKKFVFRHYSGDIGGDVCIAREIDLDGKRYLAFTNGDAMGKSLQGAGGALVMAVIFNSYISRTPLYPHMYMKMPEAWIADVYGELQRVFISFDGSMLMSAVIGLIDEETGAMYYMNAEHPWTVCYRNGAAVFTETELTMRKIGHTEGEAKAIIRTTQLEPGDIFFFGSDGRDDIVVGLDQATGQRIINEDETRFLRNIEEAGGDLAKLVEIIRKDGELFDDFTIIRIKWKKPAPLPPPDFEAVCSSANKAIADKDIPRAITLLRKAIHLYPDLNIIERLAACHRERGEMQEVLQTYQHGAKMLPLSEELLHSLVNENRRMVREVLDKSRSKEDANKAAKYIQMAIDYGERLLTVNPLHCNGMLHLADCYRMMRRFDDAKTLLSYARQIVPGDENLKTLERALERDEKNMPEKVNT
ncbi:MAG: SpoIIE family protein phosphatase [Spirochaetota bacterium]|jgi:tetratricopeptide (TPR) repeat protein|nr:SpoIIE family protein phosphatase [Spirochaetota bacterium]